ncbi:branched-chain-amino-acid aminotransferase [Apophysomyces sp. BC1015]|nr:branched-chain-amino-acid aminotransferase [Apophysomyces sp. BC1015]
MKTTFEAKDIRIEKVTHRKALIPNKDLVFGKYFTDHMFLVGWDVDKGWSRPRIKPYEKLTLEPSASVFHYGFEVTFKSSMKAYKDIQGQVRLFRPEMNMDRLNRSAERLSLPTFDSRELLKCIALLLQLDELWIPKERGYSLYLRPTMIGTEPSLGVHAPNRVLLFVIASPVGPYYPSGFSAVSLLATQQYIRSWPNGMGDTKVGGNYAPCVKPQAMAHQHGHHQNLWLFGEDHQITEAGTMNIFLLWHNEQGQKELVTPPVSGLILPGVTRNSIIELVSSWGADMDIQVYEREITMDEVVIALQRGRVLEMFGSGTACIVTPIKRIGYAGHEFAVPLDPEDPSSEVGPLTKKLNENIMDIQYGVTPHRWSVNILDYE